jgi:hypothetical protein
MLFYTGMDPAIFCWGGGGVRGKGRIVCCGDKKFTKLNINDATLNWSGGGRGHNILGFCGLYV